MLPAEVTRVPYSQLTDLEPMAEGGFGIVYRAKHKDWGVVAYKQLKSTIIKETDKIGRDLIKEAQMHVLRHPNIVAMLGVTFEVGHYGVLFEYVAYGGLDGFIETYSVDWLMKLTIANGIVRGLNYIHTKNPPVVHGDLKAQNILVDDGYVPKICDFGLSKWRTFSTTKTDSRSLRGTVTHIPPENWQNINQRRTTKYDVYGFGVLLWELLSEQAPFPNAAANVAQIEAAVVAGQRPDLEELKREDGEGVVVPEEDFQFARDTITMCWDQDPNKRPPFAELNSRFEDFLKQREDGVKKALDRLNKAVAESLENEEAGDGN
jgi:serine/threonine protein kinase